MTFTYTNSAATNTRDEVRFLVGDTDSTDQLVTDEEIAYALGVESNAVAAAARVARAAAAELSRKALSKKVGDLAITYDKRAERLLAVASSLETETALRGRPEAGGILIADKNTATDDTTRVPPSFRVGMGDDPDAGARGGTASWST